MTTSNRPGPAETPVRLPDGSTSDLQRELHLAGAGAPAAEGLGQAAAPAIPARAELPKADVAPLVRAYKRAEKRVAAAKEAQEAAKAALLDVMGGAEVLAIAETHQAVAEHREVQAFVLDGTRLKAERPRIAAAYQRLRIQRPFKVLV